MDSDGWVTPSHSYLKNFSPPPYKNFTYLLYYILVLRLHWLTCQNSKVLPDVLGNWKLAYGLPDTNFNLRELSIFWKPIFVTFFHSIPHCRFLPIWENNNIKILSSSRVCSSEFVGIFLNIINALASLTHERYLQKCWGLENKAWPTSPSI